MFEPPASNSLHKRKQSCPNHLFSGAKMFVSGRVIDVKKHINKTQAEPKTEPSTYVAVGYHWTEIERITIDNPLDPQIPFSQKLLKFIKTLLIIS